MTAPQPNPDPFRPHLHFTPTRHWINDPNGLVWFDGEYHLFYQHNPFGIEWGHMSWGHAVSTDLLHWQELPVAIAEDERVSIYSGSVVVDHANTSGFGSGRTPPLVAIYTGCLRRPEGGQAQELAYSLDRGRSWTKYPGNPVLDLGLRDFRDPKVFWHEPTARWVMVVVLPDARTAQFYGSPNLRQWALLSAFAAPFEGDGIWECPDLIEFNVPGEGRRWMLKVDVFGGHPSGGTGARLFFGEFDGTHFHAEPEGAPQWADFGADFYAALSWAHLPPGHPPTWLAWMNCHRYAKHLPTEPWRGAMTLPRELALRRVAGRLQLLQQPVARLQALRRPGVHRPAGALQAGQVLALPLHATAYEVAFSIEAASGECGLQVHAGGGCHVAVGFDAVRNTLFIDRGAGGFCPAGDALYARRHELPCAPPAPGAPLRLRVLVDACSIEVFAGEGELCLTDQNFPPPGAQGLHGYALGGPAMFGELNAWPLA